jgi:cytochrome b subunit of formate dehydrogenase
MFIAQRFMEVLIIGVFAFFWTHMLLWIFRSGATAGRGRARGSTGAKPDEVYFRRFSLGWRLAHVVLAVAVMVLVLTGTAVLFSGQAWAQYVLNLLGGPKIAAVVHRVAALTFIGIFFGHLLVAPGTSPAPRAASAGSARRRWCRACRTSKTSAACSSGSSAWRRARTSTAGVTGRSSTTGRPSGACSSSVSAA